MASAPVKIQRIRSNEGTTFSKTNPRMSFTVPQSMGFADLTQSKLALRMNVQVKQGANPVLYPIAFGHNENNLVGEEAATCGVLIRNSRTQSRNGYSGEIRRNNIVNENIEWYLSSSEDKSSSSDFHGMSSRNYGRQLVTWTDGTGVASLPNTPFLDYARPCEISNTWTEGVSVQHDGELYLPMSYIDRVADSAAQFPYVAAGDTDYHIELENVMEPVALFDHAELTGNMVCENCDVAQADAFGSKTNPIIVTGTYTAASMKQIPLWVGAPIKVTYEEATVATALWTTVTALRVDATNNQMQIETAATLPGATDRTLVVVRIAHDFPTDGNAGPRAIGAGIDATPYTVEWAIDESYLQVHKLIVEGEMLQKAIESLKDASIKFMDYKVVSKSHEGGKQISDTLAIDPMALGVAVITPINGHFASGFDSVSQYRFAIDGVETTNRDVDIGLMDRAPRALHNHLLRQWFANQGKQLRKYDMPNRRFVGTNVRGQNTHTIFPVITPMVPYSQNLNLRLQATGANDINAKEYHFVQVRAREMKITDQGIQMV